MLEKQINGFIEYCKVSGFKDRSIQSLSINLYKFKTFLSKIHNRSIKKITYRHLSAFVADYDIGDVHKFIRLYQNDSQAISFIPAT